MTYGHRYQFNICYVLDFLGTLLIAIGLFASRRTVSTVGGVVHIVSALKFIVPILGISDIWFWSRIIFFAFWVLITVIFMIKKNGNILGFVAGGVWLAKCLISPSLPFPGFAFIDMTLRLLIIFSSILLIVGAIFAGMAMKVMDKAPRKTAQSIPVETSVSTENKLERLEKLKTLLDNNVISQDEFDAKKKQLLDL